LYLKEGILRKREKHFFAYCFFAYRFLLMLMLSLLWLCIGFEIWAISTLIFSMKNKTTIQARAGKGCE
jgi:hypothetical protein